VTDEQQLHEMMANPGPPPDDDCAGWPAQTEPPAAGARVKWFEARGFRWMHGVLLDGPRDDQGQTRVRLDDGSYWYPYYENLSPAGLERAYSLLSGISEPTLGKVLTAELDARYGADRRRDGIVKGGEPRG
jgi:hypothetical protein